WIFERAHTKVLRALLGIWLITAFLHVHLAMTGWLFRYEAYLVWLLIVVSFLSLWQALRDKELWTLRTVAFGVACAALVVGIGYRSLKALRVTPIASQNIYQQQFQMAQFLRRYYPGETVVANDIGAITYFADIHLVDLFGLDGREIVQLKRRGEYNTLALEDLANRRRAKIAIAYADWMDPW